jgi:glycosyltransferase involved in cell wall biosynthesis
MGTPARLTVMKKENPLVSICIPTYNSATYLRICLDSILAQTYPNMEIIVSDNASSDGSVLLLGEYAQKHGITVHVNDSNIGAGANFNQLIGLARGKYLAIYHSDDVYHPTIVEESVELMKGDESIALVGTMADVIDAEGHLVHSFELPYSIRKLSQKTYCFEECLLGVLSSRRYNVFLITASIMCRASVFKQLGGFDHVGYQSSCDYELWLRIARCYQLAILDRKLMCCRTHGDQGSELEIRRNPNIPDIVKVVSDYAQYVEGARLKSVCAHFIDRSILKTALKQNRLGAFEVSNYMLKTIKTPIYLSCGRLIRAANAIKLRLVPREHKKRERI